MALGHVLGGGSSINAMVWTRGMERDFEGWAQAGAKGWAFKDVLPIYKAQEDWEGSANTWRGTGGPVHVRRPKHPHPTAPAFVDAAREMGMPILEDMNGPCRPGAGFINMNIRSEEHTSELQSLRHLVCRLLLEKKKKKKDKSNETEHTRYVRR